MWMGENLLLNESSKLSSDVSLGNLTVTDVSNPMSDIFPPKSTTALVDKFPISSFLAFVKSVSPEEDAF